MRLLIGEGVTAEARRTLGTPPVTRERNSALAPSPEKNAPPRGEGRRIARACRAASVPAFSPHDLPPPARLAAPSGRDALARIGELVGHDDLVRTARTYTHVVADEGELDYSALLS